MNGGGHGRNDGFELNIDRRIDARGGRVELRRRCWRKPQKMTFTVSSHYIELALSPRPSNAKSRIVTPITRPMERVGSLIFSPPGYQFEVLRQPSTQTSICCILNPSKILQGSPSEIPGFETRASLDIQNIFLESAMKLLEREILEPGFSSELLVESVLSAITLELQRHFQQRDGEVSPAGRRKLDHELVRHLENRIHESRVSEISIEDIINEHGISMRHISRIFKKVKGKSLSSYVAYVRLQRAKAALACRTTPIKRIANECGFRSVSAFSAAFRRETGVTPSTFRKASTG